jgi:hypothetical protein
MHGFSSYCAHRTLSAGAVVLGPRPGKLGFGQSDLEFGAGLVAQAIVSFEAPGTFARRSSKEGRAGAQARGNHSGKPLSGEAA